eukprot:GSMAST32.ASY1.ANO1.1030.1 assembled CDS
MVEHWTGYHDLYIDIKRRLYEGRFTDGENADISHPKPNVATLLSTKLLDEPELERQCLDVSTLKNYLQSFSDGDASKSQLCGKVFQHGDIVYFCKTCAADPTCVLCAKCFLAGDHVDHEFHYYRSQGQGGCCDCGDPEAINPKGFCCLHGGVDIITNTNKESDENTNLSENWSYTDEDLTETFQSLPPTLQQSAPAVIAGAVDFLRETAEHCVSCYDDQALLQSVARQEFNEKQNEIEWDKNFTEHNVEYFFPDLLQCSVKKLKVIIKENGGDVSDCITKNDLRARVAESFFSSSKSDLKCKCSPNPSSLLEKWVIFMHNDDVHTFDEVHTALSKVGVDDEMCKSIALDIDKKGSGQMLVFNSFQFNSEIFFFFFFFIRNFIPKKNYFFFFFFFHTKFHT